MKLVEVVIMTGLQCISPVQNMPAKTEVGKVWCAVVIEKDTVANRVEVTPPDQSGNPAVRMVVQRMDGTGNVASKSELLTIEPASAPPDQQRPAMLVPDSPDPAERVEPVAKMVVPRPPPRPDAASEAGAGQAQPETEAAATTGEAQLEMDVVPAAEEAQPETEVVASAEVEPPAVEAKPVKKRATTAKKRTDICTAPRKAVWYTNKDGHRKYRCRRPGSTANLY